MRFEIRYFFLEVGLSLKGLTQSEEIISIFKPHYIFSLSTGLRALLYRACNFLLECVQQYVRVHELIYCVFKFLHAYLSFVQFLRGGGGGGGPGGSGYPIM